MLCPEPSADEAVPNKPQEGSKLDRAVTPGRIRHLAARQSRVVLVDRYADPSIGPDALGEADVVAVSVGQNDGTHVRDRPPHRRELPRAIAVQARDPRVDDGHLTGLLDEIAVDDALVPDAVDAPRDPHRSTRYRFGCPGALGTTACV